ncbi:GNAT superfamily N-acetyltransferase [Inhella inkyongensis]|uniref:GNAT superfamily N-acetyltransferase n=1 Tax=Inhella inkyongensis TaxID=392593 RepID=A0A840S317_9BURK|nr:GNAT family N-acetyltransferase [Inhella inkyongensis]MBB5202970.1 GNAT superfamily N-acetyltransferase [Inhella inkyongensis]
MKLDVRPAADCPWADLEALFGARGACGGCWCQVWRRPRAEFESGKKDNSGAGNRAELQRLWQAKAPLGLLAYAADEPIAWVAVAPREHYDYFRRSRVLKPDPAETGVWSITCLFVAKAWRRQGVSSQVLRAAADWARAQGAQIVEGYPTQPHTAKAAPVFLWTGTAAAFEAAGFSAKPGREGQRPVYRG